MQASGETNKRGDRKEGWYRQVDRQRRRETAKWQQTVAVEQTRRTPDNRKTRGETKKSDRLKKRDRQKRKIDKRNDSQNKGGRPEGRQTRKETVKRRD
jgi:hypothetical protein